MSASSRRLSIDSSEMPRCHDDDAQSSASAAGYTHRTSIATNVARLGSTNQPPVLTTDNSLFDRFWNFM